jgi:hypothetical protein
MTNYNLMTKLKTSKTFLGGPVIKISNKNYNDWNWKIKKK